MTPDIAGLAIGLLVIATLVVLPVSTVLAATLHRWFHVPFALTYGLVAVGVAIVYDLLDAWYGALVVAGLTVAGLAVAARLRQGEPVAYGRPDRPAAWARLFGSLAMFMAIMMWPLFVRVDIVQGGPVLFLGGLTTWFVGLITMGVNEPEAPDSSAEPTSGADHDSAL